MKISLNSLNSPIPGSLEKDVTKDIKTKSVEAEMNALTLAVQRGTLEIEGTSSSVDTVSSVIPVPTHT